MPANAIQESSNHYMTHMTHWLSNRTNALFELHLRLYIGKCIIIGLDNSLSPIYHLAIILQISTIFTKKTPRDDIR